MKIEMHTIEKITLSDFADKYNLVMEIHERSPSNIGKRWTEDYRYYAFFKECEVKDGSILCGVFGNGASPDAAMTEYAKEISNKTLVINAMNNSKRKELYAPIITHQCEQ